MPIFPCQTHYFLKILNNNWDLLFAGFLSTGDEASPGNYALKDQALGLAWVQENIKFFGGDPSRITVSGHSSGAACAHFHMMSPMSQKYFRSGISMSGSALTFWALKPRTDSLRLTREIANKFQCSSESNVKLVECLRNQNPNELVAAQFQLLV